MSADPLVGTTFGNYRVEGPLGAGGMGRVYRGRHIRLQNRRVAIKLMDPQQARDPAFRARFEQEADAIQSLKHPHIVELLDFGEQDGQLYLVMELLDGGTLRTLLWERANAGQLLPLGRGVELIHQAAEGLAHAHAHGLVHRDIKPENLLLDRPGDDALLKLSDFGLARLSRNASLTTTTGMPMGTYAYMAPEQLRGMAADERSDLYAIGLVLYEAVTGGPPFEIRSFEEAFDKHLHTAPPAPRALRPEVPPELEAIILRCLAKRPEDRPASARDLADALARHAPPAERRVPTAPPPPSNVSGSRPPAIHNVATNQRPPENTTRAAPTGVPVVQVLDARGQILGRVPLGTSEVIAGRLMSSGIVLTDPSVSSRHLRIEWDGRAVLVTDLNSTNGTVLGGQRLAPGRATPWRIGDYVRVGPFWLTIAESAAAPAPALERGRVWAELDHQRLAITPGQRATARLALANMGRYVDSFQIAVYGVPSQWVTFSDEAVRLMDHGDQEGRDRATIELAIDIPHLPDSAAGEYPVRFAIASQRDPSDVAIVQASWTVAPFHQSRIALAPRQARGWTQAKYRVLIANQGNGPERYVLTAEDAAQALNYQFAPAAVELDLGTSQEAVLTVRLKRRWFGEAQSHNFEVRAAHAGQERLTDRGEFVHRSLLPRWVPAVPLALAAVMLLLWLTVKPRLAPRVDKVWSDPATPVAGESVTVHWAVDGADSIDLLPDGPAGLHPDLQAYTFDAGLPNGGVTLVAKNRFGKAQEDLGVTAAAPTPTATVAPGQPDIQEWSVSRTRVAPGDTVTIRWRVVNATNVTLDPEPGTVPGTGEYQMVVYESTTLLLTATNGGTVPNKRAANITVEGPTATIPPTPTATVMATTTPTPTRTPVPTATPNVVIPIPPPSATAAPPPTATPTIPPTHTPTLTPIPTPTPTITRTPTTVPTTTTINFDEAMNGDRQSYASGYSSGGVKFTIDPGQASGAVIGRVKNNGTVTGACVGPSSQNQLLGTGGPSGDIGMKAYAIRATLPSAPALNPGGTVVVKVDVQAAAGATVRVRLYGVDGNLLRAVTAPADESGSSCSKSVPAHGKATVEASATEQVAYVVIDVPENPGTVAFDIDNFSVTR